MPDESKLHVICVPGLFAVYSAVILSVADCREAAANIVSVSENAARENVNSNKAVINDANFLMIFSPSLDGKHNRFPLYSEAVNDRRPSCHRIIFRLNGSDYR